MQAAKQIRFSRKLRRSRRPGRHCRAIESIHLKQNSALGWMDGMCSMAANASARSAASGR